MRKSWVHREVRYVLAMGGDVALSIYSAKRVKELSGLSHGSGRRKIQPK